MFDQGNHQGALFIFDLMSKLYPNSVDTWFSLGNIQMAMGLNAQSVTSFEKVIALQPDEMLAKKAKTKIETLQKM